MLNKTECNLHSDFDAVIAYSQKDSRPQAKRMQLKINFHFFSTETYVVGSQKNRLIEHPKQKFKLMDKKLFTILCSNFVFIWTYAILWMGAIMTDQTVLCAVSSDAWQQSNLIHIDSKTCLRRPLKKNSKIGFQYRLGFNTD